MKRDPVGEIIADLRDREGLGNLWDSINVATQVEIYKAWVKIIGDGAPVGADLLAAPILGTFTFNVRLPGYLTLEMAAALDCDDGSAGRRRVDQTNLRLGTDERVEGGVYRLVVALIKTENGR